MPIEFHRVTSLAIDFINTKCDFVYKLQSVEQKRSITLAISQLLDKTLQQLYLQWLAGENGLPLKYSANEACVVQFFGRFTSTDFSHLYPPQKLKKKKQPRVENFNYVCFIRVHITHTVLLEPILMLSGTTIRYYYYHWFKALSVKAGMLMTERDRNTATDSHFFLVLAVWRWLSCLTATYSCRGLMMRVPRASTGHP